MEGERERGRERDGEDERKERERKARMKRTVRVNCLMRLIKRSEMNCNLSSELTAHRSRD